MTLGTKVIERDGTCMLVRRMCTPGRHGPLYSAEIAVLLDDQAVERAMLDAPTAEDLDRLVLAAIDAYAAAARLRRDRR